MVTTNKVALKKIVKAVVFLTIKLLAGIVTKKAQNSV